MKALESDIAALSHLAKQAATTKEQLVDIRVKQLSITKVRLEGGGIIFGFSREYMKIFIIVLC